MYIYTLIVSYNITVKYEVISYISIIDYPYWIQILEKYKYIT